MMKARIQAGWIPQFTKVLCLNTPTESLHVSKDKHIVLEWQS